MESKLEEELDGREVPRAKRIKQLAKAYLGGVGIGLDFVGTNMSLAETDEPIGFIGGTCGEAATDATQELGTKIPGGLGVVTGACLTMATLLLPWVITGMIDSAYSAYRYGKRAWAERKEYYAQKA